MKRIILLWAILIGFSAQAQLSESERKAAIQEIVDRIQVPVIPEYSVSLTEFGGKGDSVSDNRKAFEKGMQALKKKNGGTLVVPRGVYTVNGPIHFVSSVNLHLEEGAKIRFGSNPEDYPLVLTSWEGTMLYNYSPLIYGYGLSNVAITGKGTIDGEGGGAWAAWKQLEDKDKQVSRDMNHQGVPLKQRKFGKGHYLRPQMIQFFETENILLEDITIEDAPFWCVHLLKSRSATVRRLKFDAHNFNNDGIDAEYASDILIEEVKFDNGDDNIAIKAGRDNEGRANAATPSENIVIRNNLLKGLHGVVIGSEMSAGVQNVYVENNQAWGYLKRGIYFKTNPDRGGYIRNIHINNIALQTVEDCFYITANYHGEGEGFNSKISDVFITNVSCEEATGTAVVIQGFEESKVENVKLTNVKVNKTRNATSITNTKNVIFDEVIIGEEATVPTSVSGKE
ncbi:glycoside hydrolase family 28 protein [Salinimicrobium oceani]|uniref:Glycoside hydrolase family 28 protein n=1 Tax=Salinimicrobium oceani TaxID=2722702 RepID=A0ABX1CYV8_9FLAO|nr:glycoside hydrolase family 28 protein [Salinimicrobium oceani]NJW52119.1 glycoside hydrolase family 28 protein [Salinimicrobium oceani]